MDATEEDYVLTSIKYQFFKVRYTFNTRQKWRADFLIKGADTTFLRPRTPEGLLQFWEISHQAVSIARQPLGNSYLGVGYHTRGLRSVAVTSLTSS